MNEPGNDDIRAMLDADRIIHEPARLIITAILFTAESADFTYLMRETGLTRGNLSSHLSKLQEAGYVEVEKTFAGKLPRTVCRLTATGREVFVDYRARLRQTMNSLLAPPEPPGV